MEWHATESNFVFVLIITQHYLKVPCSNLAIKIAKQNSKVIWKLPNTIFAHSFRIKSSTEAYFSKYVLNCIDTHPRVYQPHTVDIFKATVGDPKQWRHDRAVRMPTMGISATCFPDPCHPPKKQLMSIILSWSWLDIWFEPMGWLVLGHVTGINSATTTCQPRPANHDLCFLGFWTNQKEIFNASICIKIKRLESYWHGNSYFINILDKKAIENCIFFHWVTFDFIQKLLLLCFTQVL